MNTGPYLLALEADIVGISVHGKSGRVTVEPRTGCGDGLRLVQPFILQPHQRLPPHVLVQTADWFQQLLQHVVFDRTLKTASTNKHELPACSAQETEFCTYKVEQ